MEKQQTKQHKSSIKNKSIKSKRNVDENLLKKSIKDKKKNIKINQIITK